MKHVWRIYDRVAQKWAQDRQHAAGEERYLDKIIAVLPRVALVLDLGCGTGHPIARYFIERGFAVTGVDAAPAMIAIARAAFPQATWIEHDMRRLTLPQTFNAIIAWDSFFHLPHEDQRAMFSIFERHMAPEGLLLFTSGTGKGESIGRLYEHALYHASLDANEYRGLLAEHGFDVLIHAVEDAKCGGHTVWLAQRRKNR